MSEIIHPFFNKKFGIDALKKIIHFILEESEVPETEIVKFWEVPYFIP